MDGSFSMPASTATATITWEEAAAATLTIEDRLQALHSKLDQVKAKYPNDPDVSAAVFRLAKLHNTCADRADELADKFSPSGGALYSGGRPKSRLAEG